VKIDPSVGKPSGINAASPASASKPLEATAATQGGSELVQISRQFRSLEAQTRSAASFDSKKVEAIKAAIAEGRFQVDAAKVADGLIATVEDLIHSRSRTA
jgi:negative regulator of flagellin synthesis FlgM